MLQTTARALLEALATADRISEESATLALNLLTEHPALWDEFSIAKEIFEDDCNDDDDDDDDDLRHMTTYSPRWDDADTLEGLTDDPGSIYAVWAEDIAY